MRFPNYAGRRDVDGNLVAELDAAGIENRKSLAGLHSGEVKSDVVGVLHGWLFKRAWSYWVAEGPGLPPAYADSLHEAHGQEVRVDGHCGCPSPSEWFGGFAVGRYHVDTPQGLRALADTLKRCAEEAALRDAQPAGA